MKRILILGLLIVSTVNVIAQNVVINIKTDNLKGKEVRVSCIDDRLTMHSEELFRHNVEQEEDFLDVKFTVDGIKEVSLRVDWHEFTFLAVPGNNYYINVLSYDDTLSSYIRIEPLPVRFSSDKDDGVNYGLEDIYVCLSDFIAQNLRRLSVKDSLCSVMLDKLQDSLLNEYGKSDYLKQYIRYEFASVRYCFSLISQSKIRYSLFGNEDILYDNIGYTECFNTVFSSYFTKGYKYIGKKDIENWLDARDYDKFNDALGRDSVLKNELFREFVFLSGMKDAYLNGDFSRSAILVMLDVFKNKTKFERHRQMADNLAKYLKSRDFGGTEIKDFDVKDINGDIVSTKQYRDKQLLVNFVKLDNIPSLKELEVINFYYDSIKDNCNVLTVCFDSNFEKMYNFIKNGKIGKKYQWPIVYFDNNWEMAEFYQIHFFPQFVLVDKDGTIIKNPVESPSLGGLKEFINSGTNKQKR